MRFFGPRMGRMGDGALGGNFFGPRIARIYSNESWEVTGSFPPASERSGDNGSDGRRWLFGGGFFWTTKDTKGTKGRLRELEESAERR